MFYLVFSVLLSFSLTSTVNALLCGSNCVFQSDLNNPKTPTCTYIDRPSNEQSCQVTLNISYNSGAVYGIIKPINPPTVPNFDGVTVFSLREDATNLTVEYDCLDTDKCDLAFVDNLLKSDWNTFLKQIKPLRNLLADLLIDSSTLNVNDTCPAQQPCSSKGFCRVDYQVWSDTADPTFTSECSNATDQPLLDWVQAIDQRQVGKLLVYTCNKLGCADLSVATNITQIMTRDYILPFKVNIPSTNTANFMLIDKILMIIFVFTSLFVCYSS